ncbi:MAG: SCO family protein [Asticcacaulis sp.]|nr:SCO family protein [Asticcacaulis sp.]
MTKLRMAIIAAAFVLLAGLAGWSWYSTLGGAPVTSEADPAAAGRIGGAFTLTDQDGKPVDQSILKGKWTAVFFGYTYCPDICPLTLQSLARTKAALGKDADKLQIVFITVDPARDTPANLKAYLKSGGFPQGVIGLTGTQAQVDAVEKAYGVTAVKQGSGDSYSYSHSAVIYLMNPAGKFDAPLGEDLPADESAKIIRDTMRGYAG